MLFEVGTGRLRRVFGKSTGMRTFVLPRIPVTQAEAGSRVAITPDGRSLAYAGIDKIIRVWQISTGEELAAFDGHADVVNAIAISPDGRTLVSVSSDTTAIVWNLAKEAIPPRRQTVAAC